MSENHTPNHADVVIYTTNICPYCIMAKRLLTQKNINYQEINIDLDFEKRAEMLARSAGRRTVPQIFIDGVGIGGYDDMAALARQGKLQTLLFPNI